jgi:hypothetical protein
MRSESSHPPDQNRIHTARTVLVWAVVILFSAGPSEALDSADLVLNLDLLRGEYAQQIGAADDPATLSALALVSGGKSWAIAARYLAERYHQYELEAALADFETECLLELAGAESMEKQQVIGFRLYYKSMSTIAGVLTLLRRDKATLREISAIDEHTENVLDLQDHPMRSMATLSQATLSMLALAARSIDYHPRFIALVDREMQTVVEKAREISQRDDVHNRGRLFLMVLNNVRGSFNLLFLFAHALDPKLAAEVEPIRDAWTQNTGDGQPPSRVMVVTLTAMAEAGFPITMYLAGGHLTMPVPITP